MSVDYRDIHALACDLLGGGTETHYRSSASRAYYASYHACRIWEQSFPAPGASGGLAGGEHQQLCNRLSNPAPELKDAGLRRLSKKVGAMLAVMKTDRHIADYQIQSGNVDAVFAARVCENSKQLITQIL